MDGNGRWAKQRDLPRYKGHVEGVRAFKRISDFAMKIGIKNMTFYAFSTENWKRPQEEVSAIMELFRENLFELRDNKEEYLCRGAQMRFIGDPGKIPDDIRALMAQAEEESVGGEKTVINIAVNYGGRNEITEGVRKIAQRVKSGELSPEDITEDTISQSLYTADIPDPDLIIRPSGELRLSNFLTWQSAYSELWFSDVLWPDFSEEHLIEALRDFEKRNRRFGGV